ncbi:MAG: TRAP transporter small permease subunit [Halioglobus sp.]|nr:TRAP transporter small permease subunit [Halioglobus sp.]
MSFLRACVQLIDGFTDQCGRLLAWLSLGMALLTSLIVIMRYGFSIGSILAQEGVIYMHGGLFLLGAAYALKTGAHVRVDIFYRSFSARNKAWVNSLGGIIFLLPLSVFILISSLDYVAESWTIREVSPEPGGIPAVFILKTFIPLAAVNLSLQGIAEILRSALELVEGPPH